MHKIQRNPNVMWREEKEALATVTEGLAQGEEVEDLGTAVLFCGGTMLSINFLGTEVWKLCDGRTVDELVQVLFEQFDVAEEVLRTDVEAFLNDLTIKGFITNAE